MNIFSIAKSLHSAKYRADIDGLRAIAVLSVVICHAFPKFLPGGFIGVDIFFVISGYLISSIIMRDLDTGKFSILNFYDRRIRRIFPALIVILIVTLLIGWLILFPPEFHTLGKHVVASTLFSENFLLWSESGYFDVTSEKKPLLHLWSLAIEEQFYIFWPLLLWVAHKGHVKFVVVLCALGTLSFGINLFDVHNDPTAAYYSPLGRFWELMIGSGLAYVETKRPALLERYKTMQSALGIALLVLSLMLMNPERSFPGAWALMPTVGTLLILSAGDQGWINKTVLSAPPMVWCGLISYPLYLWHWPILSFAHILFGGISVVTTLALVAVAVGMATATFLFVERPFRVPSQSRFRPVSLAVAMAATLVVGAVFIMPAAFPRLRHFEAPSRTEWDFLRARTASFDKNGNGIYALHSERTHAALFIGDSHMGQYAERVDRVIATDKNRLGAVMVVGGGCIPIQGVTSPDVNRKGCWALRDQGYRMADDPRFGTIVIGGAWNWYFLSPGYVLQADGTSVAVASAKGRVLALDRLQQEITTWTRAGKRVVLLLDNPKSADFNVGGAKYRLSLTASRFKANEMAKIDPRQLELRKQLIDVAHRSGAVVVDPFASICRLDECRVTTNAGLPLFKDDGHFNPDWAVDHADFVDIATKG